jgi:hypothetical protein
MCLRNKFATINGLAWESQVVKIVVPYLTMGLFHQLSLDTSATVVICALENL